MKALAPLFLLLTALPASAQETTLRVGHFPNVTHAQGVIAHGCRAPEGLVRGAASART
jgi:hypothetical protein